VLQLGVGEAKILAPSVHLRSGAVHRHKCWVSAESELTTVLKQGLAQFSVIDLRIATSSKSELSLALVIQL
jgi:hypothetical protein